MLRGREGGEVKIGVCGGAAALAGLTFKSLRKCAPESSWILVSEPGFFKVLAHFLGNLILLPEMKPRNNIVY